MKASAQVGICSLIGIVVVSCAMVGPGWYANADPADDDPVTQFDEPRRLPVITPTPSDWQPKYPFPYDQTRQFVNPSDVNAIREMCQWYDAQFTALKYQIAGLNNHVVRNNGDFYTNEVAERTDVVIANLDQSLAFIGPRAQSLTQSHDRAGDMYFPMYQGDAFYGLWQQMSNLTDGLKARQPTWFTGPSYHLMQYWGSKIHRSHVCS